MDSGVCFWKGNWQIGNGLDMCGCKTDLLVSGQWKNG